MGRFSELYNLETVGANTWTNDSFFNFTKMRNGSSNSTVELESRNLHFFNYIVYVVGVLITSTTIIGNVLVIIAVISEKRLRKVGNIFIINLAISDCLVGAIVSPLAITYNITGQWILGSIVCDIWVSVDVICCTASILNLCAIAYDRYNAIVQPIKYSRKRTYTRAWIIVSFVWLYSLFIALPRYIGWIDPIVMNTPAGKCQISQEIGYTFFSTFGAFFIPLTFMVYFYYQIYCATCFRKSLWHVNHGNSHFIGPAFESHSKLWPLLRPCIQCCKTKNVHRTLDTNEQSTQTPFNDVVPDNALACSTTNDDNRRESIEPELLAIYQMRHRSNRILSNVTLGSLSSAFYSSTDSSNTATTSFSESSDRSSSVFGEGRDRSYSSSTERSRSLSVSTTEMGVRRHSLFRGHRLSSARQSSLHTEVIHEIASAAKLEHAEDEEEAPATLEPVKDNADTDNTHDEMSDEGQNVPKPKRKLRSSTFRRRNSRKSRKIAITQEKRAAKTLGIVMGCFIICWFPFFTVTLLRALCLSCSIHPVVIQIVSWLGYFNSACNPFIYTVFNKDFESAFKKMFNCKRRRNIVYL